MDQVRVSVCAADPITLAGLGAYLAAYPDLVGLDPEADDADVIVALFDRLTPAAAAAVRGTAAPRPRPVVLVINEMTAAEVTIALECGMVSILPRAAAADDRLARSILAAVADSERPADVSMRLRSDLERLNSEALPSNRLPVSNLSTREIDVLKMTAEGLDTRQIAIKLGYSERTVKKIIYNLTKRLGLRNRSHAVAHAIRAGLI